ncbi:MAG TPA: rhomboid family intramembrane serine protease [Chitinophagaceae bacterium]|nr:rhomboid family intramembrane serine protease [Chitinophagaceae bacterium]
MNYYGQRRRNRLSITQHGNALTMLLAIHLVVFVILSFTKMIYYFGNSSEGLTLYHKNILSWVTLPAFLPDLLSRPWTLITHFFTHDNVWHLIANMLWLWAFGHILQDLSGNRKIIPIFLYGAFAGALAFIITFNLIPALKINLISAKALGASAGVMSVAIATTVLAPGYRIFPMINGGIPLWVITMIFVIIDLATIPYNNPGGHIAHLAGAGMGFLFMVILRNGKDPGAWINNFFDWVNNLFNPEKPKKGKEVKKQLFYKSTVSPYKKTTIITQQRIDEILDKIGQKGYESLTPDEKEILKQASKEDF